MFIQRIYYIFKHKKSPTLKKVGLYFIHSNYFTESTVQESVEQLSTHIDVESVFVFVGHFWSQLQAVAKTTPIAIKIIAIFFIIQMYLYF
jgi:hypothetical protein